MNCADKLHVAQLDGSTRIDALIARNEELDEADDRDDRQIVLATTYRKESLEALPQEHRDGGQLFRSWSIASGARGDPERREYAVHVLPHEQGQAAIGEPAQLNEWIHGGWTPKQMCCSKGAPGEGSQVFVLLERDRSVANDQDDV